jgi:uncharacterized membrane protein YoaK (UPF0700 family)
MKAHTNENARKFNKVNFHLIFLVFKILSGVLHRWLDSYTLFIDFYDLEQYSLD